MDPSISPYHEKKCETYEDKLIAFRTRADDRKLEETRHIATYFHQYAFGDQSAADVPAGAGSARASTQDAKSAALRAYPIGVPHDVPACVRHREDVVELFTPQSIMSIVFESKRRAKEIVRSHYQDDDGAIAFGSDASEYAAPGSKRVGVPHDYKMEEVVQAVQRDDKDPLAVMMSVRETLSRSLSERGRVPSVPAARQLAIDELAGTRVHMACHADRVRSKELMLHSTDVPERFIFGAMRNASRAGARSFRKGADDAQREKIQNRWNDSASHHLVRAAQRLPSPTVKSNYWSTRAPHLTIEE